ncbi:hypothetical protein VaNZ11_013345 [Volvox africanus]|uniref:Rhodanese domain-containing protein n=1 Tax=Volvox africanus TaxID=51714 RepID=A0ABQ5SHI1_9CHLO|nr:hypothetical protein VaNZ11_013345 [Volvox africanus]
MFSPTMSTFAFQFPGLSLTGRLAVVRPRPSIVIPQSFRLTSHGKTPPHLAGQLYLRQRSIGTVFVAEVVGPSSDERSTSERFLDVHALLSEFNPLTENHLLVWEDSDDEDGAVQAELPYSGAWEDGSAGYQGLEYQPSWIDYRDGSESDDSEARREAGDAHRVLSSLVPILDEDDGTQALGSLHGDVAGSASPSAYSPEAGFQEISVIELEERLATSQFSLLLDVRSRQEYDGGHIAGAFNLPLDPDLSAAVRSGSLDEFRGQPVAVVCGSGMRSGQATVRLSKVYGFSNVTNVNGGMMAWAREGLPIKVHQHSGGSSCGCGSGGGCRSKQSN